MMHGWTFAARTADEVASLARALGRHRYVKRATHELHFTVDEALAFLPEFARHAEAFRARLAREPALDPASRDPSLYRAVDVDEAMLALATFWTPGERAERARAGLERALAAIDLPPPTHAPFASDADDPPHPELVCLAWELLPIDELDAERHAGAIRAMELAREDVDVSAPVFQEGPALAAPELLRGAPNGALVADFLVWSDGAYSYADYVLRGAAKAAKLVDPPVGLRDEPSEGA